MPNYEELIEQEKLITSTLKEIITKNAEEFAYYWHFGDGAGGGLLMLIHKILNESGHAVMHQYFDDKNTQKTKPLYQKSVIAFRLRKQIFERDAYRCQHCGSWTDLTVDHVKPESLGGDLSPDNLQTLCRSCNSKKGTNYAEPNEAQK